jgi:hypothetical protein
MVSVPISPHSPARRAQPADPCSNLPDHHVLIRYGNVRRYGKIHLLCKHRRHIQGEHPLKGAVTPGDVIKCIGKVLAQGIEVPNPGHTTVKLVWHYSTKGRAYVILGREGVVSAHTNGGVRGNEWVARKPDTQPR